MNQSKVNKKHGIDILNLKFYKDIIFISEKENLIDEII